MYILYTPPHIKMNAIFRFFEKFNIISNHILQNKEKQSLEINSPVYAHHAHAQITLQNPIFKKSFSQSLSFFHKHKKNDA